MAHRDKLITNETAAVLAAFVFGTIAYMILLSNRFERFRVIGDSMMPTLYAGDKVVISKRAKVRVGDIVVLEDPRNRENVIVKRLAGISDTKLYVLGDNSSSSTDSRHFGAVPRSCLIGSVKLRYFPVDKAGSLK